MCIRYTTRTRDLQLIPPPTAAAATVLIHKRAVLRVLRLPICTDKRSDVVTTSGVDLISEGRGDQKKKTT